MFYKNINFNVTQSQYKARSSSTTHLQWYCIGHFIVATKYNVLKMIWKPVVNLLKPFGQEKFLT